MTAIPVGPTTRAGITGALGTFILAVVALATNHSPEAIAAILAAGAQLITVLAGRYAQAHAAIKTSAAPGQEPGDAFDGLPHHPVTDPATIPTDRVDLPLDDARRS